MSTGAVYPLRMGQKKSDSHKMRLQEEIMKNEKLKMSPNIKTDINGTEVTLSFSEQPNTLTKNNIINILLCAYDGKINDMYY